MLFASRHPPDFLTRVRLALWPRRSWARSSRYTVLRVRRMSASPRAVGIGCAAGVFSAFTPFLGFQLMIAAVVAWALRGSIVASAAGTFIGNPFTYPLIWLSTYKLGTWILGWEASREIVELSYSVFGAGQGPWTMVVPMFFGSIPLGLLAATATYYLARKAVEAYREKKRQRLMTTEQRRS
ncbi:MAG: DUF2062 domain-containing protein, partial [Hyphomicrobiales bacterium]